MPNLLKYLKLASLAAMFAMAFIQLDAQIRDTYYHDVCNQKTAKLIVTADANFNAKKMNLDFRNIDQSGSWLASDLMDIVINSILSS